MRKKIVAAAIITAFALSACGNRAGESVENTAKGAVLTGRGISVDGSGRTDAGISADGSGQADAGIPTGGAASTEESASANMPGTAASQAEPQEQDGNMAAAQEGYAGTLQVTLPEGWTYDACPENSDRLRVGDYGIQFYPEDAAEGFIELCYKEVFGVCGTGLALEKVTLAGDRASIGTYDNGENWDYVSFHGTNEGVVALTYAVEGWWPKYGEQALEILDTVRLEREAVSGSGESGRITTIACGANEEPENQLKEYLTEDSRIEKLGLSLEVTECTGTGATLVFRQSGGSPAGELTFGEVYSMERYEDGAWADVPVAITGNYAFTMPAYIIPLGESREFQIDWEWLYGELAPGEYRIKKTVDDFRKTADYDVYEIYAYFRIDF